MLRGKTGLQIFRNKLLAPKYGHMSILSIREPNYNTAKTVHIPEHLCSMKVMFFRSTGIHALRWVSV